MAGNTKVRGNVSLSFLPKNLMNRLMPFQQDGVKFCVKKGGRCIIGDEMGLGKTLQALSIGYFYKSEWPMIIVVPSSLKYPWIDELEKWFPMIGPTEINLVEHGTDIDRINTAKVTIVTYGLLRASTSNVLREALLNQNFQVAIVDESHYIKNRKAGQTKFVVPLVQKANRRLLLTGTPALARPAELYPQIEAIDKNLFKSWTHFASRYCDAGFKFFGRTKRWSAEGATNLEELQSILVNNIMIRRLKKDVLTQLPPKQRQKISFDLKDSVIKKELDGTWGQLESALGRKNITVGDVFRKSNADSSTSHSPLFEIHRLIGSLYQQTGRVKVGPVKEYLKMMVENKSLKMLVFAHHHVMMDAISEVLNNEGVPYVRIDGKTHLADRPLYVNKFQTDELTRVAVLSMKAAGVGLTLTAANLVIFAELDWTPGCLEQCEDRAHRIGQRNTVHIHYLVAKHTLDDWVWSALERKTTVISTTLNGKTHILEMDSGNRKQVEVLANADAYSPEKIKEADFSGLFSMPLPNTQRSILDYVSPSRRDCKPKKKIRVASFSDTTADCDNNRKETNPTHPRAIFTSDEPVIKGQKHSGIPYEWNCISCTFKNSGLMKYCEICETKKPDQLNKVDQAAGVESEQEKSLHECIGVNSDRAVIPTSSAEPGHLASQTTDNSSEIDIEEEEAAAHLMFSSAKKRKRNETWSCKKCGHTNLDDPDVCEQCLENNPENGDHIEKRSVNLEHIAKYDVFSYCCSMNSNRIFLYAEDEDPLHVNFIPLEVEMGNWSEVPDLLLHPNNLKLVQRFVREWKSLSATKKRVITRTGQIFRSPIAFYDDIKSKPSSTIRYRSKAELSSEATSKAKEIGGTLKQIKRDAGKKRKNKRESSSSIECTQTTDAMTSDMDPLGQLKGVMQVVGPDGRRHCVQCQEPYSFDLVPTKTADEYSWQTRFCSGKCSDIYNTAGNREYSVDAVYAREHGVCQMCKLDAHGVFQRVRRTNVADKRVSLIQDTPYAKLKPEVKERMCLKPSKGQFWNVDHIIPVADGGGRCDLDNLRTLCTICHMEVTAKQARDRAAKKRKEKNSSCGNITDFLVRSPKPT